MIPYPSFTNTNYWGIVKENIVSRNPSSIFKFKLLLDSQFRYWLRKFINNTSKAAIDRSNDGVFSLNLYGIHLWKQFASEVTSNPDLFDYHHTWILSILTENNDSLIQQKKYFHDLANQSGIESGVVDPKDYSKYLQVEKYFKGLTPDYTIYKMSSYVINPAKF